MNILVAGGQSETKKRTEPAPPKGARERGARNGRGGKLKTTAKVAAVNETSTRRGATARLFPRAFRQGRMSN